MSNTTLIKALVAGGVVITGILLSDNETVRGKLGKTLDILSDVEKAIKNPLGSLANSLSTTSTPSNRNLEYWDYRNNEDQRRWEMEKMKLQHAHEERMASLKKSMEESDKEETNGSKGSDEAV